MRILHCADLHMDSPFDALTETQAVERRREQRELLTKIAELCESENAQLVLLAGDLLDSTVSFHETRSALTAAFGQIQAKIFIAPGNHDYYCAKSPYAYIEFPENVHIFKSPEISYVELPELGCRVWGAGFTAPHSTPLLTGFSAPESDLLQIMVMHGDMGGDAYNHISKDDIERSGLDYLALGHTHLYSGIKKAGKTFYAYPGCPEGRGFDETGAKGVIAGNLEKGKADLRFVPLGGREYRILEIDLTDTDDASHAAGDAIREEFLHDICRIVFTGEYDGEINREKIAERFAGKFYSLTIRDNTRPKRDIWSESGEDTLRGIFLRGLREKLDGTDDADTRAKIELAARFGLAALEGAEEVRL